MASIIQRSMAGGEISPSLVGRADTVKFQTGVRTMQNFMAMPWGAAMNRPGTQYIADGIANGVYSRLVKFVFNDDQTYVIEFGAGRIRFFQAGAQLQASGSAWITATSYEQGDIISNGGSYYYCKADHTSGASDEPGVGGSYTTYWYIQTDDIFQIPTSYGSTSVIETLHFVQSADVLIITHPSYPPAKLSRYGDTDWTLTDISFVPTQQPPDDLAVTAGGTGGGLTYRYVVTAFNVATDEESLPGVELSRAFSNATPSTPVSITTDATHGYATGDVVYIPEFTIPTGSPCFVPAGWYTITVSSTTVFTLDGSTGTTGSLTALPTTYYCYRAQATISNANAPTAANPHVITWTEIAGGSEYNVYREESGVYGFIGTAVGDTFSDIGYTPDISDTPPQDLEVFAATDEYPAVAAFIQQRLCFGRTNNEPQKVWMSRPGNFFNFSRSSPVQDDDSIIFTLAGRKVNEIRAMVEVSGKLVILTSGGEITVEGDGDGVIRPTAINPKVQGYSGSEELDPVVSANNCLYVQARGSVLRDFRYQLQSDGYEGGDLTIFAKHLLSGLTVESFDFAETPYHIAWLAVSDGTWNFRERGNLLGFTYLKEHEVWAWHQHDVGGTVFSVCVVPEDNEDVLYMAVRRVIDGSSKTYIERLNARAFTDVTTDAIFMDCALTYDGRNTGSTTLTLSTGAGWTTADTITVTAASGTPFVAGDVGNIFVLNVRDDYGNLTDTIGVEVVTYTSSTVVSGTPTLTVPAALQGVAVTDWSRAVDELAGLDHLEGETVAIIADGNVLSQQAVASGALDLGDNHGSVIHVGLPITADLETLDYEDAQGETRGGKVVRVEGVTLLVEDTRGLKVGRDENNLTEFRERDDEDWDEAVLPYTGQISARIEGRWTGHGRVLIRQSDPLPASINAIIRHGEAGGR
jgi:hypothetical protein